MHLSPSAAANPLATDEEKTRTFSELSSSTTTTVPTCIWAIGCKYTNFGL